MSVLPKPIRDSLQFISSYVPRNYVPDSFQHSVSGSMPTNRNDTPLPTVSSISDPPNPLNNNNNSSGNIPTDSVSGPTSGEDAPPIHKEGDFKDDEALEDNSFSEIESEGDFKDDEAEEDNSFSEEEEEVPRRKRLRKIIDDSDDDYELGSPELVIHRTIKPRSDKEDKKESAKSQGSLLKENKPLVNPPVPPAPSPSTPLRPSGTFVPRSPIPPSDESIYSSTRTGTQTNPAVTVEAIQTQLKKRGRPSDLSSMLLTLGSADTSDKDLLEEKTKIQQIAKAYAQKMKLQNVLAFKDKLFKATRCPYWQNMGLSNRQCKYQRAPESEDVNGHCSLHASKWNKMNPAMKALDFHPLDSLLIGYDPVESTNIGSQ